MMRKDSRDEAFYAVLSADAERSARNFNRVSVGTLVHKHLFLDLLQNRPKSLRNRQGIRRFLGEVLGPRDAGRFQGEYQGDAAVKTGHLAERFSAQS